MYRPTHRIHPTEDPLRRLRRLARRWISWGVPCLLLGGFGFYLGGGENPLSAGESLHLAPTPRYAAEAVAPSGPASWQAPSVAPVRAVLKRGETLGDLMGQLGVAPADTLTVVDALGPHLDVRRVRPGLEAIGYPAVGGGVSRVELYLPRRGRIFLASDRGSWTGEFAPFPTETTVRSATGTIEGSLVGALTRSGAPAQVAYAMADVLQWDVDFHRDLRTGDSFSVLFEEVRLDGRFDRVGQILAVQFVNRGRAVEAYRFDDGYYDAEGRPLEKMFLRSPMPFSRVTSKFNLKRFHPVLKKYRPHYGVDYGAPVGTPVKVTANGVVTQAGWNGGAGRMVKVRHPNDYQSAYLHLSRIADGIRPGQRVRQGEVIGYVGATGLATGPHLDYRVQHRGRWIDPLTLKAVPAEPIDRSRLAEYMGSRDRYRSLLGFELEERPAPEPGAPVLASRSLAPSSQAR